MKKALSLISALVISTTILLSSVFVSADTSSISLFEYYNTGDDIGTSIYGANISAQSFTPTESHDLSKIRLKLYRQGDPGYLLVSIKECSGYVGDPEGLDLSSAYINASALSGDPNGQWREVDMPDISLEAGTTYSIVLSTEWGTPSDFVGWRFDSSAGNQTGMAHYTSVNSGITWSKTSDDDYMFEIWGDSSLAIPQARVFKDYHTTGDWLVVCEYTDKYAPYYPYQNVQETFALQLLDGSSVVASVPVANWGLRPGAIYLNKTIAENLEWGQPYVLRISYISGVVNATYTLQVADWRGNAYTMLDAWCLALADKMGVDDGKDYTVTTSQGKLLNAEGGILFAAGIPYLPEERPGIFQYVTQSLEYSEATYNNSYINTLPDFDAAVGPDVAAINAQFATWTGMSSTSMAGFGFFLLFIFCVVLLKGQYTAGLVLAIPILLLAANIKAIAWGILAVAAIVLIYKWLKAEWLERT